MAPRTLQAVTARLCLLGDFKIQHLAKTGEVIREVEPAPVPSRLLIALALAKKPKSVNELIEILVVPNASDAYEDGHRHKLHNAASAARDALGPAKGNLPSAGRRGRYELKLDEILATDLKEAVDFKDRGEWLEALKLHHAGWISTNLDDHWLQTYRDDQREEVRGIIGKLHRDREGPEGVDTSQLAEQVLEGHDYCAEIERWGQPVPSAPQFDVRDDDANTGKPRRLGDVVRKEIADLYKEIDEQDLKVSFWERPSTDAYIKALAALKSVTLYVGAGVSADVHAPLSDQLMQSALLEELHPTAGMTDEQLGRIVAALSSVYPPAYLGSIAREFVRQEHGDDPDESKARRAFVADFNHALKAGRNTGGFLAFSIGTLAFALRKAGKDPVRVLTTTYDEHIDEAEGDVHALFTELGSHKFTPYTLKSAESDDKRLVPLYSLNGQLTDPANGTEPDPLIVGEADALTPWHHLRSALQDKAFTETSCIFVGSSLAEPDVLAKLVNQEYDCGLPRYAVVLTPSLNLPKRDEHALALNLMANRFLHLGVVPIIIDFPHQAPQFLIEVALRLLEGESYENYPVRLNNWWEPRAKDFGFGPEHGEFGGRRNVELQHHWKKTLAEVRDNIYEHLNLSESDRDEQINVEVWLRRPDPRELILWATSEGIWENANTAHRCKIYEGDQFAVQQAFRDGRPGHAAVDPPRGIWKYQLCVPLVLRGNWRHLPVGVASIMSSKPLVLDNDGRVSQDSGELAKFLYRQRRQPTNYAEELATLCDKVRDPAIALLSNLD